MHKMHVSKHMCPATRLKREFVICITKLSKNQLQQTSWFLQQGLV